MSESLAYAISKGALKVVSDTGVTLLGDVENVSVTYENEPANFWGNQYIKPNKTAYRLTADFVAGEEGKFLTIVSPKTKVAMRARVEINENTLPAISAAHVASGAPDDAEVEVVKGMRIDNLEDQWIATFTWEEQR